MARAAVASPADVDAAVKAARAAFEAGSWSNAAASARAKVLYKIADLIRSNAQRLATLEARNAGKPIRDARDEVMGAAQCFEYYAGAATRIFGETIPGVSILQQAAPNITRVSLELGGKSPNIIFADADLDKAAPAAVNSVFGNAGQDCCARSRAFVHRSIAEEFDQRVATGSKQLKVGDPLDAGTEVGPLISIKQRERVQGYIEVGRQEGARLLAGGAAPGGALSRGSFLEPTVFDRAENRMRIAQV